MIKRLKDFEIKSLIIKIPLTTIIYIHKINCRLLIKMCVRKKDNMEEMVG